MSPEIYEFGDFRLDVGEHRLACPHCADGAGGVNSALPEKAFLTLVHLLRHRSSLVTHDELLRAVWPHVIVENNNVGKAIHAIRRFLGESAREPRFVQTVPKHGYRFIADVKVVGRAGAKTTAGPAMRAGSPAYDLYVRAKVKALGETLGGTNEAIDLLEQAIALDPSFAPAWAQLARACNTRTFKFSPPDEARAIQEGADVALAKALDLDPALAEAHFARGLILWTHSKGFPHEHAIHAFQRALELDPDADETHHQLSMVLAHVGLLDEALAHVRAAVRLNPNNTMARFRIGVYAAWQCRFDDAMETFKTIPSDASPMLIDRSRAEVLVHLGRRAEARAIVDAYLASHAVDEGGSFTSIAALLLALEGKASEAEAAISRAVAIGQGFGHFHHTAHNIASALAVLGRVDDACGWLESAADVGFPCEPLFRGDPNLRTLRRWPRFAKFLTRLKRQREVFGQIAA
jgi:DNA-binding winged helix-turn-helix (wHTH) protein/tetratricopeptide (TPR) repeat protein